MSTNDSYNNINAPKLQIERTKVAVSVRYYLIAKNKEKSSIYLNTRLYDFYTVQVSYTFWFLSNSILNQLVSKSLKFIYFADTQLQQLL